MKKLISSISILFLLMSTGGIQSVHAEKNAAAIGGDSMFPGRSRFPDIKFYEIDEFKAVFDDVTILDARPQVEFNTLHINGAINIPLDSPDYVQRVRNLASEKGKPIVSYCNGKTCMISWKAARKAIDGGLDPSSITVYDLGVLEWAKKYPDQASLFGKTPVDTARLIPIERVNDHMIEPDEFALAANNGKGIVLDIRNNYERTYNRIFMGIEQRLDMSDPENIEQFARRSLSEGKPLYIYDNSGSEVYWLMYHLVEHGVSEYYFMKNGANGYFNSIAKKYLPNTGG